MQLQSPPLPKEKPVPQPQPLSLPHPPQRNKRMMIQIQELQPPLFVLSIAQPQSLLQQRAISLIRNPPKILLML